MARPRLRIPSAISHARPAAPFVARTLAVGVTGGVLLYGGTQAVQAWGKRNDGPPLDHSISVTGEGTLVRTPDGGLAYLPGSQYLKDVKDLGYNPGVAGQMGVVPIILDQPASADQSHEEDKHEATLAALTNPVTLLIVGGVIAAIVVLRRK